jgi:hypothetical protein
VGIGSEDLAGQRRSGSLKNGISTANWVGQLDVDRDEADRRECANCWDRDDLRKFAPPHIKKRLTGRIYIGSETIKSSLIMSSVRTMAGGLP